ncbi:MAG: TetR/AcrR family transcriptional regulator [Deltaproteobacteria bacterium]|nr:TetR/AcrR family transcriptional regulator [Nannocystaceae bacterium]
MDETPGKRSASPRPLAQAAPLSAFFSRNKILSAASDVFAGVGARATTVEDILRAAGISRRTFYRFFESKENVLQSLFEVSTALFIDNIRGEASAGRTPIEKLERGVDAYLGFGQRAGPLMRVLNGEASRPDSPLAARKQWLVDQLVEFFSAEADAHHGHHVDPLVLRGLLFALEGLHQRMLLEPKRDTRVVARYRAVMIRILVATLAGQHDPLPQLPFLEP